MPYYPSPLAKITRVLVLLAMLLLTLPAPSVAASPVSYYVDCNRGDDRHTGRIPARAWQTLDRANRAQLAPGDRLLLRRGCVWTGTLVASWKGTNEAPILIGSYGEGALPIIQNAPGDLDDRYHINVLITGSHLIIEKIQTTIVDPPIDPDCAGNPVGFYVGFNFVNLFHDEDSGSYNLLRQVHASAHTAGVHLTSETHHNRILHSTFIGNRAMHILTPAPNSHHPEDPGDDIGAWGVLLRGSDHEVAYNYFSQNHALCTYDTPRQGNAIELYEAQNATVHHNVAVQERHFSELGGSAEIKSQNNRYVYNVHISSIDDARFVILRGGRSKYGPTLETRLYHNTVYLTGNHSQAITCGMGCSAEILTAKNNIFWAEEKILFADAPFNEGYNLYWNSNGEPYFQLRGAKIATTSILADPVFMAPDRHDLRLQPNSPAIDAGMQFWWAADVRGVDVPVGAAFDIGAYEQCELCPRETRSVLPAIDIWHDQVEGLAKEPSRPLEILWTICSKSLTRLHYLGKRLPIRWLSLSVCSSS